MYILFIACVILVSCSTNSIEQDGIVSDNSNKFGPQIESVNREDGNSLNSF